MFNNQIIAGSSGQGGGSLYPYSIDQSLRFDSGSTTYLSKTFTTNADSNQIYTFSCWFKRGELANPGIRNFISSINTGSGTEQGSNHYGFYNYDTLWYATENGGENAYSKRVIKDPAAWSHFVVQYDTTQSTATDRLRIYLNGENIPQGTENWVSAGFGFPETPALNSVMTSMNQNGRLNAIGAGINTSVNRFYFDGYLAEIIMLDGVTQDCTAFGEFVNGVWMPKEYTGQFGTNGYRLDFADSGDIGKDVSGNNNDWTPSNLAATDVVSDSPTNSFCTLNPLTAGTYPTLKEGNLSIATVYSADLCGITSTWFPTTGKWYWEVHNEGATSTYPYLGITDQRMTMTNATKGSFYSVAWLRTGGVASMTGTNTYMGTITTNTVTSWTNDDIIMFALDVDNRKLWIGKNGTWDGSGDPAAGTGEDASWTEDTGVSPSFMGYASQGVNSVFNFGQDGTFAGNQTAQGNADENGVGDFYYSPPSGFLAMATSNIEDGDISPNSAEQADDYFDTVLWTGNGTNPGDAQEINGLLFQPDFVWVKGRSGTQWHEWHDSVRGVGNRLFSNQTSAETNVQSMTSFDNDGFTVAIGTAGNNGTNENGSTYVGWSWKAGGTAVSNTDGSITSSVSANQDAGFSIVSYTGNATAGATIGHGLSSAPEFIIGKNRTDGGTTWAVYAKPAGNGYLELNTTAAYNSGTFGFNNTDPTSTVFTVDGSGLNTNAKNYIAYCFHSVDGYSKVGKYSGNSIATNGAFVYTGFKPAFVVGKAISQTGRWWMYDSARTAYNDGGVNNGRRLEANSASAESTADSSNMVEFYSNGFKVNTTNSEWNGSGLTYIYLAFAEQPFKYANAR